MDSTHSNTDCPRTVNRTSSDNDSVISLKNEEPVQPPLRLQHSPSLPNIRYVVPQSHYTRTNSKAFFRFQPHSESSLRPTVETRKDCEGNRLNSPMSSSLETDASFTKKTPQHRETQSIDDVASYIREIARPSQKKHQRRATGKADLNQALLTPPLTPASSLKNVTGADSATEDLEESVSSRYDTRATRFLLVDAFS
jgi:hypothetical protein